MKMLKIKVMLKKQTSLGIEQQSDHAGVLHILKNNENTSPKMNNNLLGVWGPILMYHRAKNLEYVKKQISLRIEQQSNMP